MLLIEPRNLIRFKVSELEALIRFNQKQRMIERPVQKLRWKYENAETIITNKKLKGWA